MPKPRKDWKALNIKIQSSVYNELEKYCEETGLSKTVAVERILSKAFKEYEKKKISTDYSELGSLFHLGTFLACLISNCKDTKRAGRKG